MCLAVPAQVVECDERLQRAVADLHGNRVGISLALTPEVKKGDWVLVHAGFAIKQVDSDDAMDTWALLEDLADADAAARAEMSDAENATASKPKKEAPDASTH